MKNFKTFVTELYNEPEASTFTHQGKDYNLNGILSDTLGMPQKMVPVSDMQWILKWDPMTRKDAKRIRNADLSAPLLVVDTPEGLAVVDGIHRLAAAIKKNVTQLPTIEVPNHVMMKNSISSEEK